VKSNVAENPCLTDFFLIFATKRDSPLQINCENFIMGCTVGFRAILTLEGNRIAHALYLSARSCDTMYRARESKSKLELFYWLFMDLFCHILLAIGLKTCLNGVGNYYKVYRSVKRLSSDEVLFVSP